MKWMRIFLLLALFGSLSAAVPAAEPPRIGTFDSRAVALAWYNTAGAGDTRKAMDTLQAELAAAKKRGDTARIAEIEATGTAMQQLRHQQVFSNGSIRNLFEGLAPALRKVAEQRALVAIVSRWELAWSDPTVVYVDVTDDLVNALDPPEKVRTWVMQMKEHEPLALDAALAIRD